MGVSERSLSAALAPHRTRSGRRALLLAGAGALIAPPAARAVHFDPYGAVKPPKPFPRVSMRTTDGRQGLLGSLLEGRVSALQLMFTGCSATCPIQGALFADVQRQLRQASVRDVQLLSISIDPLTDDPARLKEWLARFGAAEGWLAAQPALADLERLLQFLASPNGGPVDIRPKIGGDRHTGQVYLADRQGKLMWVTSDFPAPTEVARMLRTLAA